jgi:hypothetical protein
MPVGVTQAFIVLPGQSSKTMIPVPASNVAFDVPIGNLTSMPNSTGNELRIYVQASCESAPLGLSTQ